MKNDILNDVKDYQQRMAGISGRQLLDYIKLSTDLYRSVFEGGYTVTVNYGKEDVTFENKVYSAKSYEVERVEEAVS